MSCPYPFPIFFPFPIPIDQKGSRSLRRPLNELDHVEDLLNRRNLRSPIPLHKLLTSSTTVDSNPLVRPLWSRTSPCSLLLDSYSASLSACWTSCLDIVVSYTSPLLQPGDPPNSLVLLQSQASVSSFSWSSSDCRESHAYRSENRVYKPKRIVDRAENQSQGIIPDELRNACKYGYAKLPE